MIWWIIFIALEGLPYFAAPLFVPAVHRQSYTRCHKGASFWLANLFAHGIWIVSAIQNALAPTPTWPVALRIIGAVMMAGGYALIIWARRANPFFAPAVIVPRYIVTAGPYRVMKHPGYFGLALVAGGTLFLLGQLWAFWPTLAYLCVISRRITVEDRILASGN